VYLVQIQYFQQLQVQVEEEEVLLDMEALLRQDFQVVQVVGEQIMTQLVLVILRQ
jgi:hypothetical protein